MILYYDTVKEFRDLTTEEANGREIIKTHLQRTLDQQRIYWKQRATIRKIKFGKANTKYFQVKATIKNMNTIIAMLKDEEGVEHVEHNAKATVPYRAFKARLGIVNSIPNPLQLHQLLIAHPDQIDLEAPFSKEEIDLVIKKMLADKSPRHDGFNVAFLKRCWEIIAPEFYKLIEDFHQGTVNIQSINYSYITLMPKIDAASSPRNYRPISLLNCTLKIITSYQPADSKT